MNKLLQLITQNLRPQQLGAGQDKNPRPLLVRNAADPASVRVYVYDVITPYADEYWGGYSAKMMISALAQIEDPQNTTVHVHINSPGGDAFEGRAIRTALKQYAGPVVGHVDALAASAATTVADGCDTCDIAPGALFMIHNAWTMGYGDKQDFLKTIELLEKVDGAIAQDYQRRTGHKLSDIAAWMNEETWFTAEEAVAKNFCSAIADENKSAQVEPTQSQLAEWNLSAYNRAPVFAPPSPADEPFTQSLVDIESAAWTEHVQRRMSLVNLNLQSKV